jgi:TPR repeat protein
MKRVLAALLVAVITVWPGSAAADIEKFLGHYKAGEFAAALRELQPLIDAGDPFAQNVLGVMYAKGQGVAKDDRLAVEWYRKAAEQGDADAQTNLGFMYANGRGVAKDRS